MRLRRLALRLASALASVLVSAGAAAVETPNVGGKPVVIDITNTAVTTYHFNNRNDFDLNPLTQVDDFYGEFLDRLNIQATWWRFRLGVRLDTAVYFHTLDRDGVAALVKDQTPAIDAAAKTDGLPPQEVANKTTNDFYNELHSRFLRAIYPSKLFLGYEQSGLDVTVGDFYVQLGRGLVFSVRKIDELAVDTTVRGVKVVTDRTVGGVQIGTTLFAGQMNPLRVDEASGRRLNGSGSPLFFGFPVGGDLETYDVTTHQSSVVDVIDPARPSYLEDTAFGGAFEAATRWFTISGNAAGLYRRSNTVQNFACHRAGMDTVTSGDLRIENLCASRFPEFSSTDPSQQHDRILNFSGALNVPSIQKHGDLYVEVAGQQMAEGHYTKDKNYDIIGAQPDLSGYAVYVAASVNGGPVSASLEGKHYRNFFPLSANIDSTTPGFGAPEFSLIKYSQPPTAEPVYTEVVSGGTPSACVTGGRARIDYRFNRHTSLYAWLGRYASWSEIPLPLGSGCTIEPANQTNIWDAATGVDLGFEKGRSHVKAWVGARTSEYESPPAGSVTTAFYREGYVRYDIIKHLSGPFSLQLQGWHRHRYEPISFDKPWTEGENYTALQWSPHLSAAFGFEYLLKEQCQPGRTGTLSQPAGRPVMDACYYVNGGVQWRSANAGAGSSKKYVAQLLDGVGVFVGQRRGATRCVSGVCRQFPPFEGARLEVTSRF